MRKKNQSFMALNIIYLFTICHYYFTVSCTKQEQTEEESKTCGGKIINI